MQVTIMTIPDALQAHVTRMAENGESSEALIAYMRAKGLPKPQCIRALANAMHIGLGDAKNAVHFSPTWGDRRASDEAFHEGVFEALEQIQREDGQPAKRPNVSRAKHSLRCTVHRFRFFMPSLRL